MNNGNQPVNALGNRTRADIIQGELIGLTKREHFAGLAMQGLLIRFREPTVSCDDIAICAREQADALLKELEK